MSVNMQHKLLPVVQDVDEAEFASGRGLRSPFGVYIGDHLEVFTAYASRPEDRVHVASGGVVTTLLAKALRDGIVDGVAVSRADFSEEDIGYRFDILTDPAEVQNYGTSAYFNIPVDRHWRELDCFQGRLAVCSLPCHTGILRKRVEAGRGLSNVKLWISLFCGHNNEVELLRFVLGRAGIDVADVQDMRVDRTYLGGHVRFSLRDGREESILFRHFNVYRSLWFFSKAMCRYCDDHLGAKSDLSIGDVFVPEYRQHDYKHSAIIARSQVGLELVQQALDENLLTGKRVDPSVVFRGQKRVVVPSGDLQSRYFASKLAGFPVKRPDQGRFRVRSFLTYSMLMLNSRLTETVWGRCVLEYIPRPLLYGYIAGIKLLNNTLAANRRKQA
jgi:coenzyme F420 hydrogenase subunit beta